MKQMPDPLGLPRMREMLVELGSPDLVERHDLRGGVRYELCGRPVDQTTFDRAVTAELARHGATEVG